MLAHSTFTYTTGGRSNTTSNGGSLQAVSFLATVTLRGMVCPCTSSPATAGFVTASDISECKIFSPGSRSAKQKLSTRTERILEYKWALDKILEPGRGIHLRFELEDREFVPDARSRPGRTKERGQFRANLRGQTKKVTYPARNVIM